jgi:hypothetical protein
VVATLTLSETGNVSGRTATGVVASGTQGDVALQREKVFTTNTSEIVNYSDLAGNTGQTTATVNRIDTTAPQSISLTYAPATATNQDVVATLITNEPIQTPSGRTPIDQTTFTKRYTANTTETVSFSDLVGNT